MHPDPRPDLTKDTQFWQLLLKLAEGDCSDPYGLYGALSAFRCYGAVLEEKRGRLVLAAGGYGPEYQADREKWLMPHKKRLIELLRELESIALV